MLVGEATYRATQGAIEYGERRMLQAKGKTDPLAVYEALRVTWSYVRRPRALPRAAGRPQGGAQPILDTTRSGEARPHGSARHARRRTRDRQEPARVGAPAGARRRAGARHLAPRALSAVRRRRDVLGARRDGQGAGGDPRERRARTAAREARPRQYASSLPTRREADGSRPPPPARRAGRRPRASGARRRSPPGGVSSRRSRSAVRSCWSSRTCTGPTMGLLDFLDHLADWATHMPLVLLCTARPELRERRVGWGSAQRTQRRSRSRR